MTEPRFGEGRRGGGGHVEISAVLDGKCLSGLFALAEHGALVSFSKSRDGGAVAVTVTWDGEWEREWFRDSESALPVIEAWERVVGDLASARPAASEPVTRQRRSRGR